MPCEKTNAKIILCNNKKNAKTDFFAHIRRKCVAHRAYKCAILNTLCIKNIKIRKMWILNFYLCHVGAADNNK